MTLEKKQKGDTIVSFKYPLEVHSKLKIFAILYRNGDLKNTLLDLVKTSKEVKTIYSPITNLKTIPLFTKHVKNCREGGFIANESLHKKIKVMCVINNVSISQLMYTIIFNNCKEYIKNHTPKP